MKAFGLYTDIQPALDRPDVFLAVSKLSAEPEPCRDLLHFPDIEPVHVHVLARRMSRLDLPGGIIPRLYNLGLQEEQYFLAFTLGPLSVAPTLGRLRSPVPPSFWPQLSDGLKALHAQGLTYGHLRDDTVAITDRGAPFLFDVTSLRSAERQPPEVDIEAMRALQARLADG